MRFGNSALSPNDGVKCVKNVRKKPLQLFLGTVKYTHE